MFRKSLLSAVALSAVAAAAHAQSSEAYQYSVNYYDAYASGNVGIAYYSYSYTGSNYGTVHQDGSSYNTGYTGGVFEDYTEAVNESYSYGSGSALQFNGYAFILTFTNYGSYAASFGLYSGLYEYNYDYGNASAQSISFGGFQESGGEYAEAFDTINAYSNALATSDVYTYNATYAQTWYENYDDPSYPYGEAYSYTYGGFSDTIGAGQSISVEVWASGVSQVGNVPGPAAAISFGLAALLRRRRKNA